MVKSLVHTAGEHDRCIHTDTHCYNRICSLICPVLISPHSLFFHLSTPFCELLMIPLLIAQHPLTSLQAAILNLFPDRTHLSFFFYYMTAGIFHFHAKIVSKKVISLHSLYLPPPFLPLPLCLSPEPFLHPYSLPSSLLITLR